MTQVWKARFGIFLVEPIDDSNIGKLDNSNIGKVKTTTKGMFVRAFGLKDNSTIGILTVAELRQIALFQGFHDKRHQSIG
jgi:hypothetical protein